MAARGSAPYFWLINGLIWAVYAAVSIAMGGTFAGGLTSGIVAISVLLGALLWVSSAALRATALRYRWLDLEAGSLALRLALAVALLAAAAQLLIAVLIAPALRFGWVELRNNTGFAWGAVVWYWINTAIVLGLWTAGWAARRVLRRARESELASLRAESDRHLLELDALRARLNPHFIFNALNNLRALILEDPARARELVTRLSSTLRHALEHSQHEWTTVRQELQVVQDHLAVESVHYEDRLRPRVDVDDEALDARVPPMALQLLVENAIKHGIACTPGGGELNITARCEAQILIVEVDNPGSLPPDASGTGVGLAFLRNRLQRVHGRFELSASQGRVVARLEIPQ
ncbi:sensor histidine kinase [Lysobacter korlensis]|uniref:Sensor histidine kinase n=1 Tax=Lysobacter korlensis TaxID=553636 RepID=A0ABV6RJH3_9GAMM